MTSGSTTVNVSKDGKIQLKYTWTAGTPNVIGNYTPISWKLELISLSSGSNIISSVSKSYSITTDGSNKTGTATIGLNGNQTKILASGTKNIYHDADGKKTFNYSFSQEIAITYAGYWIGTISGSGSGELDQIKRTSTLGNISDFTIGNNITLSITKYNSSFIDNVIVKIGSTTIKTVYSVTNGSVINFTQEELNTIYSLMPNVSKSTFTFVLVTMSDLTTTVGINEKNAIGTINSNVIPNISSVSLSEAVSSIATQFGVYVQNYSKIKGVITATPGKGASIKSYKTTINGYTYTTNSFTTGALTKVGENSFTVVVTDSRERTTTYTGTFYVNAYNNPEIKTFTVVRCDKNGVEDSEGEYVKLNVEASIQDVLSKNNKSFSIEYKVKGGTSQVLTSSTSSYSYELKDKIYSTFSTDDPYQFKLIVSDFFYSGANSVVSVVEVPSAYTIMDVKANGKAIAFGKVANEDNIFDIGFEKTRLSKDVLMGENDDNEKSIYFSSTVNSTYPHSTKYYGGNGNSQTALGIWDGNKNRAVFQYFDGDLDIFRFNGETNLQHGNSKVESVEVFNTAPAVSQYKTKNRYLDQSGIITITPVPNVPTYVEVFYPIQFEKIANVLATPLTNQPGTEIKGFSTYYNSNVRTYIYVTSSTSTPVSIRWRAVGIAAV